MNYDAIRRCAQGCRFTDHARREMESEPLGLISTEEVLAVLETGEIIEEYSEDVPYPSCLVFADARRRADPSTWSAPRCWRMAG